MSITEHRILFMGMGGVLSLLPLQAILNAGANVVGLIEAGTRGSSLVPLVPPTPLVSDLPLNLSPVQPQTAHEAWKRGLPVWELGDWHSVPSEIIALEPTLIIVSCFPYILPCPWLTFPQLGCLNLHPSLLPAYRGPAPIFHQFRAGEEKMGVTVHVMDEGIDTGDILRQRIVPMPDGIRTREATRRLAAAEGELLVGTLARLTLPRIPQDRHQASYQSHPSLADRTIPLSWTARRAFNFVRGAEAWGPFTIEVEARSFRVYDAVTYDDEGQLGTRYRQNDGVLELQFGSGIGTFRLLP